MLYKGNFERFWMFWNMEYLGGGWGFSLFKWVGGGRFIGYSKVPGLPHHFHAFIYNACPLSCHIQENRTVMFFSAFNYMLCLDDMLKYLKNMCLPLRKNVRPITIILHLYYRSFRLVSSFQQLILYLFFCPISNGWKKGELFWQFIPQTK